jgi:hypothetical protein
LSSSLVWVSSIFSLPQALTAWIRVTPTAHNNLFRLAHPILGAELAVMARNKAVADERRRTSPLGLIFALLKKPRTEPIGYFRGKYALQMFEKAYAECSHEEQLQVRLSISIP